MCVKAFEKYNKQYEYEELLLCLSQSPSLSLSLCCNLLRRSWHAACTLLCELWTFYELQWVQIWQRRTSSLELINLTNVIDLKQHSQLKQWSSCYSDTRDGFCSVNPGNAGERKHFSDFHLEPTVLSVGDGGRSQVPPWPSDLKSQDLGLCGSLGRRCLTSEGEEYTLPSSIHTERSMTEIVASFLGDERGGWPDNLI